MTNRPTGFIGIGNMGWPMAANLVRSGRALLIHDRDADRMASFAKEFGVATASSPKALGAQTSEVITMLPDGKIVRDVVLGDADGLVHTLPDRALIIDMSSSDPVGTRELGAVLQDHGIQLVDAPVSGGVQGAINASLTIMIGSNNANALARARPLLSLLGKRLFETGPLGSGHAMKALNNMVAAAGFAALSEVLIVGGRFGLDQKVMIEILNSSTGRSFNSEHTFDSEVLSRSFSAGFALSLLAKDVRIAAALSEALELETPMMRLTGQCWQEALAQLGSGKDFTEAFRYWEDLNADK